MGKLARINALRKEMGLPVDDGNYQRSPKKLSVHGGALPSPGSGDQRRIVLFIPRADVESMNIGPTLKILESLSVSADAVRGYCGRLIITFDGYDNDQREVWEIPEIRSYFAKLTEAWPYWLWFMNKAPAHSQIPLLTFLLLDGRGFGHGPDKWYAFSQPDDVLDMIKNHGNRMLELLHGFEIPREAGVDVLSGVARQMQLMDQHVQSLLAGPTDGEKAIFH
ncbi:hypothetical protein JKG47_08710 [Acidithiobacillus sp. MC6.1]|nr:hypothetical protein [Acidithiobacillus sp. MC6.1]